eukprot:218318_1
MIYFVYFHVITKPNLDHYCPQYLCLMQAMSNLYIHLFEESRTAMEVGHFIRDSVVGWSINSQSLAFIEGLKELINTNCFGYECIKKVYPKMALNGVPSYAIEIKNQHKLLIFGKWMYDGCSYDDHDMCKRRYNRYQLLECFANNKYSRKERLNMLMKHKENELRSKIKVHEHVLSLRYKPNTPFIYSPAFIERVKENT